MQDFYIQFAERPEDVELHRRYDRETARRAAMPFLLMHGQPLEVRDRWYRPPLWEQGRTALAKQAGYASVDAWIAALNPSPMELDPDPVRRSMRTKLGITSLSTNGLLKPYLDAATANARVALAEEAARFPVDQDSSFSPEHRQQAAYKLSSNCLAHLGFKPAKTRPRSYVAFDLDVSRDLVLRWSIGDRRPNFLIGWSDNCRPELHLRERSSTRRAVDSTCLEITYVDLVDGMQSAYGPCQNEREMGAIFYAHSLLVGWLLPHVLRAVHENIPDAGS